MSMAGLATTSAAAEHPPVSGLTKADCGDCHNAVSSHRVMHGPVAAGEGTAAAGVRTGQQVQAGFDVRVGPPPPAQRTG